MKCKGCGIELGTGETNKEYCDGFCAQCYDKKWIDTCEQCGQERELTPAPFSNLGDPYGWCKECQDKFDEIDREYTKHMEKEAVT